VKPLRVSCVILILLKIIKKFKQNSLSNSVMLRRNKIIFLQPAYAHYRKQLFDILAKKHNILFVFERLKSVYPGDESPKGISYRFLDNKFKIKWIGLIYYLLKNKPDIVITSVSTSLRTIISFLYAHLFGKKLILWIIEWRKLSYKGFNLKKIYRKIRDKIGEYIIIECDALIVGGTAAYNYAVSLGKKDKEIFKALQCSNDIWGEKTSRSYTIKQNNHKYIFLYLSRIISLKGLDILIKAFSFLEKERKDVFLLIVGDGPFRNYCSKLSTLLKIKNIKFEGSVNPNSVGKVYQRADVFVLPSCFRDNFYEAWGLVINEAMSMHLPIITTNAVGAAYDLVINGYNGFVVQQNDVIALYKAMKKILELDLSELGNNSRKLFEEKNNFKEMANGFSQAINYVISQK